MPDISIIIPTLNEEHALPQLLASLRAQVDVDLDIIIADGGSTDDTLTIARSHQATIVHAEMGRAAQMNEGARHAKTPWLFFIHADCDLPSPTSCVHALATIKRQAKAIGHERVAGHCTLKFTDTDESNALAYQHLEAKTRSNRPFTINGDQGFLIHADFFWSLGGYDRRLPFLEDQRLARQIRRHGQWVTLPCVMETSARRFESEGFAQRYTIMSIIMGSEMSGFHEFFDDPEHIYPLQHHVQTLDMTRFFKALRSKHAKLTTSRKLKIWYNVGRFARRNSWQPFFYLDIRTNGEPSTITTLHDDVLAATLDHPLFDLLIGGMAYATILHVLPGYWMARERLLQK